MAGQTNSFSLNREMGEGREGLRRKKKQKTWSSGGGASAPLASAVVLKLYKCKLQTCCDLR